MIEQHGLHTNSRLSGSERNHIGPLLDYVDMQEV